jgi:hypothetical protein
LTLDVEGVGQGAGRIEVALLDSSMGPVNLPPVFGAK